MESTSFKSKFLGQINNSFGSGGMSLALNEAQFSLLIQFPKKEGLPIKKAVLIVGLQNDAKVWVLGKHLQITITGEVIDECDRVYIWLNDMIRESLCSVSLDEVLPKIKLPLSSTILHRLVEVLRIVMQHNFIPAMIMMAGAILSLHYVTVTKKSGCPIVVAEGMSQTGKSTALLVSLGLLGISRDALYERPTNCFVMQHASASTLPFGIDDPSEKPTKGSDLNDILVELYNQGKQASLRRGTLVPKSLPLVATNYKLRQEERVQSRVCVIPFTKPSIAPTTEEQQEKFYELEDMLITGELSSACGWAIKQMAVLEDKEKFKAMRANLRPFYQGRSVLNWTYVALCLQELFTEAGFQDELDVGLKFIQDLGRKSSSAHEVLLNEDVSIVQQTIQELIDICSEQPVHKVLEYMRTDVQVNGQQVLAVVLADIASSLSYTVAQIRTALTRGNFGHTRITKDFLKPGEESNFVTRNVNSRRRKCETFVMHHIDSRSCEHFETSGKRIEETPQLTPVNDVSISSDDSSANSAMTIAHDISVTSDGSSSINSTTTPTDDASFTSGSNVTPADDISITLNDSMAPADDVSFISGSNVTPADDVSIRLNDSRAPADDVSITLNDSMAPADDVSFISGSNMTPADDGSVTYDSRVPADDASFTPGSKVTPAGDASFTPGSNVTPADDISATLNDSSLNGVAPADNASFILGSNVTPANNVSFTGSLNSNVIQANTLDGSSSLTRADGTSGTNSNMTSAADVSAILECPDSIFNQDSSTIDKGSVIQVGSNPCISSVSPMELPYDLLFMTPSDNSAECSMVVPPGEPNTHTELPLPMAPQDDLFSKTASNEFPYCVELPTPMAKKRKIL